MLSALTVISLVHVAVNFMLPYVPVAITKFFDPDADDPVPHAVGAVVMVHPVNV